MYNNVFMCTKNTLISNTLDKYKLQTMKKTLTILILLIFVLSTSCENSESVTDNFASKTTFEIGGTHYEANRTTSYQTEFGQILKATGDNFEFYIILSDTINSSFNITDTIKGLDNGKAKCIFKQLDGFKFSTAGTITYNFDKKIGAFSIDIEDLKLENGLIKVDTVIKESIIDFTGITMRDYFGNFINSVDANDWIIRSNLEVIERSVFNVKTNNSNLNAINLFGYPNPFSDIIRIELNIPIGCNADLFLVNTNFEIEKIIKGIQSCTISLLLDNPAYKGNYYRLFYKIYSDSEQVYGSGDLEIEL